MQVAKCNSTWIASEKKFSVNFCYWFRQEPHVLVTNVIWEGHHYHNSSIEESWPAAGRWVFTWRLSGHVYHCGAARRITRLTWGMTLTDIETLCWSDGVLQIGNCSLSIPNSGIRAGACCRLTLHENLEWSQGQEAHQLSNNWWGSLC